MDFYRIKHKPTGLYYRPGQGNNLTKKGKIYTSGGNVLNYFTNGILIRSQGKLTDLLKQHYSNVPDNRPYGIVELSIPKSDFVIEPVNIN